MNSKEVVEYLSTYQDYLILEEDLLIQWAEGYWVITLKREKEGWKVFVLNNQITNSFYDYGVLEMGAVDLLFRLIFVGN